MRYLLLLFILSCSSSKSDNQALGNGQCYTQMCYHKSSPKYNLKGPIKEVTRTVWYVTADTSDFKRKELDSIATLQEAKRVYFNKKGYITEETFGGRFAIIQDARGMHTSLYHYDTNRQISTVESFYSSYKTALKGEQDKKREPAAVSHYTFSKDTIIHRSIYLGEESVTRSRMRITDTSVTFYGYGPEVPLATDTSLYIKGKDNIYRWSSVWSDDYIQNMQYEFSGDLLRKRINSFTQNDGDTTVTEHYYNEYGDIVNSKEVQGPVARSPYHLFQQSYRYDSHSNWIEMVVSMGAMVMRVERREITYWE